MSNSTATESSNSSIAALRSLDSRYSIKTQQSFRVFLRNVWSVPICKAHFL